MLKIYLQIFIKLLFHAKSSLGADTDYQKHQLEITHSLLKLTMIITNALVISRMVF